MILELCLVTFCFVLLYQYIKPRPPNGFPPGPTNYPIVGGALGMLKVSGSSADKLQHIGKTYGPIAGLYFGKTPSIIINDYDFAKEIFASEEFSHRPSIFQLDYLYGDRALGVFFANGALWKEQRRFTLRTLRDFGFGKSSLEGLIHEEAEECINSFTKALQKSKDSVISVHDKFGISMINILWAIISGTRFSHDDEKFQHVMSVIQANFRSGSSAGSFFNDYPWLRHIPIVNKPFKAFFKGFQVVFDILNESLQEHKTTRDPNFSRDFFDVYLKEMDEEKKKGKSDSTFFEQQLLATGVDLFNAGAESTSNTVAFAVLYMILYPEIQEKVHDELDKVVGKGRLPSIDDKSKLDYVEAVLTECYRVNPIAPVSVPHTCVQDVKFHGHVIPKSSVILIPIQSIHRDKKYWIDPKNFRPERFLDAMGKFVKPERVIPFGMGKRVCLGEPLARMSAFLLFTAVMQRFKFEVPAGEPKPSTIFIDGFTVSPQPFNAKITLRN